MSGFQVLQMLMLEMNNDWPFRATTPLRKPTHRLAFKVSLPPLKTLLALCQRPGVQARPGLL